ncbi:MAG: hypothetical protein OXP71_06130 [Candidatus Poribacteria bacterium]|nr:hypothetical protein [Candidatus Poribacteria bacterium]
MKFFPACHIQSTLVILHPQRVVGVAVNAIDDGVKISYNSTWCGMKYLTLMVVLIYSELETPLTIEKPFDNKSKNCT